MPDFSVDDIEIEPYEFVSACSKKEIRELVQVLKEEEGYIILEKKTIGSNDSEFSAALEILQQSKMMLTLEEEQMIIKLGEKFKHIVLK